MRLDVKYNLLLVLMQIGICRQELTKARDELMGTIVRNIQGDHRIQARF